jgi:uncharacterized membrane protein YoaK (UPF0700 family)
MPTSTFSEAKARATSLTVSALLAAAGGYLDAFTYVGHGRVFANAMTGNVVLLGVGLYARSWADAFRHLPPILAFVLGVCVSEALQRRARARDVSVPYMRVLVVEIAVLAILSCLPPTTADFLFTVSIAFAASVQVQTFREVNGRPYSSTFTTGNLRTLSEAAYAWVFIGRDSKSSRVVKDFSVICVAFLLGAIAGAIATRNFDNRALWLDVMLLLAIANLILPGLGLGSGARSQ